MSASAWVRVLRTVSPASIGSFADAASSWPDPVAALPPMVPATSTPDVVADAVSPPLTVSASLVDDPKLMCSSRMSPLASRRAAALRLLAPASTFSRSASVAVVSVPSKV